METSTKPLSCPFCAALGSKCELRKAPGGYGWWVSCMKCKAKGPIHAGYESAVMLWNHRAAPNPAGDKDD